MTEKQAKNVTKSIGLNKGLESIDMGAITESQYKYISANV